MQLFNQGINAFRPLMESSKIMKVWPSRRIGPGGRLSGLHVADVLEDVKT